MKKNFVGAGFLALGLLVAQGTQATLIDHGNGTFTDDSAGGGLMWTQDANLFLTQYTDEIAAGYDIVTDTGGIIDTVGSVDGHNLTTSDFNTSNGRMTWWGAMAWADWLNYGGHDDWRLWTVTDNGNDGCNYAYTVTDCGYNVLKNGVRHQKWGQTRYLQGIGSIS